jgi:hypothetical protein
MNRKFSLDPDHVLLLTNRKRKLPARQEDGYKIQGYAMNEKLEAEDFNTESVVEVIDLGDVVTETRQTHNIQAIPDSPGHWSYF